MVDDFYPKFSALLKDRSDPLELMVHTIFYLPSLNVHQKYKLTNSMEVVVTHSAQS